MLEITKTRTGNYRVETNEAFYYYKKEDVALALSVGGFRDTIENLMQNMEDKEIEGYDYRTPIGPYVYNTADHFRTVKK